MLNTDGTRQNKYYSQPLKNTEQRPFFTVDNKFVLTLFCATKHSSLEKYCQAGVQWETPIARNITFLSDVLVTDILHMIGQVNTIL